MSFKPLFLSASMLSLFLSAASAHAQFRPAPGQIFDTSDANSDGKITRDEFRAGRAKTFGKLDRNSDGFVDEKDTPRRLRARQQDDERMAALRKELDTDGDGRVSRAEFDNGPMPAFERADANNDGELDADEIAAAKAAAKQLRAARKG